MPTKAPRVDKQTQRTATINLRLQAASRDLIDRAAAAMGRSRTDFMVEAARREAEAVLLDRCYFTLDPTRFAAFQAALDKQPADNLQLRRLLRSPPPWER
jgi:uncharacterized protein (DUF1778 family)